MKQHIAIMILVIFSVITSHGADGKIIGGVHLGMPTLLNVDVGYEKQQYGFKIAGMYSGNRETNDYWWNNGAHLDVYKNLNQNGAFGHSISSLIGYVERRREYSRRYVYAAVGYGLRWKVINFQGGVGSTLYRSDDSIFRFFPYVNIGLSCKLFEF